MQKRVFRLGRRLYGSEPETSGRARRRGGRGETGGDLAGTRAEARAQPNAAAF